jgi:hypothetical protein
MAGTSLPKTQRTASNDPSPKKNHGDFKSQRKEFYRPKNSLRGVARKIPKERRCRQSLPAQLKELQPNLKKKSFTGKNFPDTSLQILKKYGYTIVKPEKIYKQSSSATGSFFAVYNVLKFFNIIFTSDLSEKKNGIEKIPLRIWKKLYNAVIENPPDLKRITVRKKAISRARAIFLAIFGCYIKEDKCKRFEKGDQHLDDRYIQAAFPNQTDECYKLVKQVNEQLIKLKDRASTNNEENFMVPIFGVIIGNLLKSDDPLKYEVSYLLEDLIKIFTINRNLYQNTTLSLHKVREEIIDNLLETRKVREEMTFLQKSPPHPKPVLRRTKGGDNSDT